MKRIASYAFFGSVLILSGCADHHLSVANEAYEMLAFEEAAKHYEKALKKQPEREASVRLAECYRRQNELDSAAYWYDRAEVFGALQNNEHLHYAQVLMGQGDLIVAREHLVQVLTADPDNDLAADLMFSCVGYPGFFIDTTLFTLDMVKLKGVTNEFSATPMGDGILFVGEKKAAMRKENPWNGMGFLDLYTAKGYPDGTWSDPVPVPGAVNGKYHEGSAAMGPGETIMYFTRSNYTENKLQTDNESVAHLQIFMADQNEKGMWGNVQSMPFNSTTYSTGHPALSKDGKTIYFISDMPGGMGGTDLYSSTYTNSTWSKPQNLGDAINSQGEEMFPWIQEDTLYFSSTAHQNMGGLDIFRSVKVNGEWTMAENLRYPINTQADDFSLVIAKDGRTGFISSTRSGSDRIYGFQMHDPTFLLTGTITNANSRRALSSVEVRLIDLENGDLRTTMTNSAGQYSFDLDKDAEYLIQVIHEKAPITTLELTTFNENYSKVFEQDVALNLLNENETTFDPNSAIDQLMAGGSYVVKDIYYDYDRAEIRPDAEPTLLQLVRFFKANPDLKFELSSHTDSRASDGYNLRLSKARARVAVEFLVAQGVQKDQIKAKGYGEREPVNGCKDGFDCSEADHQLNRRTEFKIIGDLDGPLVNGK